MKKLIFLFTFLIAISSSFLSCRNNAEGNKEVLEEESEIGEIEYEDNSNIAFGDNDRNNDALWDSNEFGEAYDEDWSTWDADGDGALNDREFYNTSYGWTDANNDNRIEENEWNEGYNNLFGDYGAVEDFGEYDANDDGFLDNDEWFEGWGDSNWFNDYDSNDDKLLDNNEWNTGIFNDWDEDGDGFWNENEYSTYNSYYDTW